MRKILIILLVIICFASTSLFGCNFYQSSKFVDERIHNIDFVTSAMDDTDFQMTSLNNTEEGFQLSGYSKMEKSVLTGVQYVDTVEDFVNIDYNINYTAINNQVDFNAMSSDIDYNESIVFSPDMTVPGKYDGTILIDNNIYNIFDYEDDKDVQECGILTGVLCGIALWKVLAGAAIATVAITMSKYPEFYVKGLENIAANMESSGAIVLSGMTYILTKPETRVLKSIKTITDSKKFDKYYPTVLVNSHNIANYPRAEEGTTLISKYPVKRSQAIKYLKTGTHIYTLYSKDAKSIISSAWLFSMITRDPAHRLGQFPHYHSSRGYVNGYHIHSFYGGL